ncbi:peptidase M23 [Streptomyces sp. NPDC008343]|uniref:peptidase M23 n=1 Tax=Streptomyces sp. NPDC008343 TaxID=3364828 RepID=UPI0036EDE17E
MDGRDALSAAANLGGTWVKIKVGAVAAVVFLVFLFVVGIFSGGSAGKAYADSCGGRGQPGADLGEDAGGGTAQQPGGDLRKKQIENAKIIDGVAEEHKLSGRATLIALATALQESTLLNIDYGDAKSVGLFQQQPPWWGTKEQIMKPEYAATAFFFGGKNGSPRGLTDIKGWESMPLWKAAAAVQHPKKEYEQLYAGQEDAAREIAREAGIDLDRAGTGDNGTDQGGGDTDQGNTANGGECYDEAGAGTGKVGDPFHDGSADWPAYVKNPRSTADAIAWAENEAKTGGKDWYRACLAFVAQSYGWSYSGVNYAIDHYKEMPDSQKHDGDRNPPPGALMYWDTGHRAGHVAIYLGDGKIASNDIKRVGYIDIVPATDIETKWGATYLGWAPPYFPAGG